MKTYITDRDTGACLKEYVDRLQGRNDVYQKLGEDTVLVSFSDKMFTFKWLANGARITVTECMSGRYDFSQVTSGLSGDYFTISTNPNGAMTLSVANGEAWIDSVALAINEVSDMGGAEDKTMHHFNPVARIVTR